MEPDTANHPVLLFPELFEAAVGRAPDAVAVVHGDTTVTYGELNDRANRLARRLIALGVGPDALVAVAVPRSVDLVTTLLAVLKAGGGYLPLDPAHPAQRLAGMTADAAPVLLVRAGRTAVTAPGVPELVLDDPDTRAACGREPAGDIRQEERLSPLTSDHLLYVIFTSGSTGTPKGVAVTHQGVPDLVATQRARFGARPGERVLQWASVSFDAAFWDLSLALASGATLVLADADAVLPGRQLTDLMIRHDITHAVLPPAVLSLTDSASVLKGGTIMSTGDACTPALVRAWAPGRRMFNGYGPTEVTVGATISGPLAATDDVTIGVPWTGGRVYVLDERLRPVPEGEEGELYLAGAGLARGYLNRPGLTATRFLPDPFGPPGSRMYRSGDRGGLRADGELLFAGRADGQVKLRGVRIELGEVEARLADHPEVEVAAAVVDGVLADAVLVAYVQPRPGCAPDPAALRRHVAQALPAAMVPASVVVLDTVPLTVNGKIDRRALHDRPRATVLHPPTATAGEGGSAENGSAEDRLAGDRSCEDGSAGDESTEQALCRLVAELLSLPAVRPGDNLFELGGNSLVAAKLAIRIRGELGLGVTMRSVLQAQTLTELAQAVRSAPAPVAASAVNAPGRSEERSR
ncbi:non-ribosomal peptide synthetase [Streptomyces sp. NPDC087270]|uniref:non-ribosomal peptide synthetase n=1 Tax=Streptomyces sp. NPDC087270 TaxID=3365774 RepID=UPI0038220B79